MLTSETVRDMVGDRIFAVRFLKRKDDTVREMNCRLGVTRHLTGGDQPYDPKKYDLLTVFDLQIGEYRSIPLDRIIEIRANGQTLSVGNEVSEPASSSAPAERSPQHAG